MVSTRVVNPILSIEPAKTVLSPSGVEEREFQRAYQWDARHNAYGPGGVGSNLYFPNGEIPPPPLIVTPEPVPVEHPEPV